MKTLFECKSDFVSFIVQEKDKGIYDFILFDVESLKEHTTKMYNNLRKCLIPFSFMATYNFNKVLSENSLNGIENFIKDLTYLQNNYGKNVSITGPISRISALKLGICLDVFIEFENEDI